MIYLENRKQRMDIDRIMKMNKSLASFMDSHQNERMQTPPDQDSSAVNQPKTRCNSTDNSSEDELPQGNRGREYSEILNRASTLLSQSLALQENGGGVIFLDTAPKFSGTSSFTHSLQRRESGPKRDPSRLVADTARLSRTPSDEERNKDDGHRTFAAILAHNVCVASFDQSDQSCQLNGNTPDNIPVKSLLKFIKKVPAGQVYHFPELRDPRTGEMLRIKCRNPQHQSNVEEADVRSLFSHFRGAVEIILVPLWNTHLGRWSICLVYTLSSERNFTFEIDYFFCRAFCNCVKAEIDRCAVELSTNRKVFSLDQSVMNCDLHCTVS